MRISYKANLFDFLHVHWWSRWKEEGISHEHVFMERKCRCGLKQIRRVSIEAYYP